jgi:GNAT superfamily N-acetyltransferase
MKIEMTEGFIEINEIDKTEEGYENLDGFVIDLLFVKPECRKQGFARNLLKKAYEYAGEKTIYLVACPKEKNISFSELVDFYMSEGFDIENADMPYPLMSR